MCLPIAKRRSERKREQRKHHLPRKGNSIRRTLVMLRLKIKHFPLNLHSFRPAFSRIDYICPLAGGGIFSILFCKLLSSRVSSTGDSTRDVNMIGCVVTRPIIRLNSTRTPCHAGNPWTPNPLDPLLIPPFSCSLVVPFFGLLLLCSLGLLLLRSLGPLLPCALVAPFPRSPIALFPRSLIALFPCHSVPSFHCSLVLFCGFGGSLMS